MPVWDSLVVLMPSFCNPQKKNPVLKAFCLKQGFHGNMGDYKKIVASVLEVAFLVEVTYFLFMKHFSFIQANSHIFSWWVVLISCLRQHFPTLLPWWKVNIQKEILKISMAFFLSFFCKEFWRFWWFWKPCIYLACLGKASGCTTNAVVIHSLMK